MAMPHSTADMGYIPVEEEVGTWVVVRAPDSPEPGTGPAGATTASTGHLPNGSQALEREDSVCSVSPDEEGWGEGEDVVDMGFRIGDKPLQPETRAFVSGRPGSRTFGSSAGSRPGSSRLSSKASSVGEASDVPFLSEGNVSTPETGDLNNSAVGKEPKLQASQEPTLSKVDTGAATGSTFPTHLGREVQAPGIRESSSESDASVPGSPTDEPLLENTDHGPECGARVEDTADKGVGFGAPVIREKSSKSQISQVEKSKSSMRMSQSSNSLKRKHGHSSGKSFSSEVSFKSERGPRSSQSLSMMDRLHKFFSRSSSNKHITDMERSLSAKMAGQLSKAGGGDGTGMGQDLQGSPTAECKENIIVPAEAHSVSLRPRRGSDREEEVESNEEPSDLAPGPDDQKVEHWLEDTRSYRLDRVTLVFCVLSLVLYVADVATDVKLAVEYMQSGHPVFGLGTLGIFLVTVFLNILVGLFFYSVEWQRTKLKARSNLSAAAKSCATDTSVGEVDNLQSLLQRAAYVGYFQDDYGENGDKDKEKIMHQVQSLHPVICGDQKNIPQEACNDDVPLEVSSDHQEGIFSEVNTDHNEDGERSALVPNWLWGFRIAFTLVGLGPAWRIMETLRHGFRTRKKGLSLEEMKYHYQCFRQDSVTLQLLQLLEGFLEAAPQLIWQLYIYLIQARMGKASEGNILPSGTVIYNTSSTLGTAPLYDRLHEYDDDEEDFDDVGMWQAITLSLSAVSLAVAPSLYQRAMRKDSMSEMSWGAVAVYFIWRVCEVVPRVLCLALFASVFQGHILIVTTIHWVLMVLWLHCQRASIIGGQSSGDTALQPDKGVNSPEDEANGGSVVDGDEAAENEIEESRPINSTGADSHSTRKEQPADVNYEVRSPQGNTRFLKVLNSVFLFLLAHMLIFCHLNAKDGRTRFRALVYYVLFYLENMVMGVMWYVMTPDLGTWYHAAGFVVVMAALLFHVIFQLVYYHYCHPERVNIPACLESRECKHELQNVICSK